MKKVSILMLILATSTLMMVEFASAQSVSKPSVPEFAVYLIDSSYETQPTTTIDPYTGQTVTNPSQHVEARTIQIKIKYFDFTPFQIQNNSNAYTVNLHYNVRWKGHFETDWHEIYSPMKGYAIGEKVGDRYVVSYQGNYYPTEGLIMNTGFSATFPPNAQIDFQVEALIGYVHHVVVEGPFSGEVFEGQTSDWSNTQTLKLADSSVSASPNPSPSIPEFPIPAVLCLLVALPLIATVLARKKRKKA